MVNLKGNRIETGQSFNSQHETDSADNDSNHASDTVSHEDRSSDVFLLPQDGPWQMKKVNTVWIGGLLIIATVSLLYITAIIFTVECTDSKSQGMEIEDAEDNVDITNKSGALCYVPSDSLIMYLQSLLWGLFLICDQFIQYEHIKLRRRGYLEFYNETRNLSQMPFCIVSAWCALLLTVSTVLDDNCESDSKCGKTVLLGKADYTLLFVGLEGILILAFTSFYTFKVHKFNSSKLPPDVLKEEFMSVTTDYNPNSAGQLDEEIFQRQADVIRHLSEHNALLRREVMHLNRALLGQSRPVA